MAYGAPGSLFNAGYVRVNKFNDTSWLQFGQNFTGGEPFESAGQSVALSSDGLTVSMVIDHVLFTKNIEWYIVAFIRYDVITCEIVYSR